MSNENLSENEASADSAAIESVETATESPKRRRMSRNKWIALGASLLLVGGGGAWAYSAYQSPSTVIGMAIGSLFNQAHPSYDVTVKSLGQGGLNGLGGELTMKISTSDEAVDVNTLINIDVPGFKGSANLDLMQAKNGDAYLQLSKFDSLMPLLASYGGLDDAAISAITSAIDSKWVKVSADELSQYTGGVNKSTTCLQDKFKDTAHANDVKNELIDLAKSHEFMVVTKELGTKDGSVGYQMGVDTPQLKQFLVGFVDSKMIADMKACEVSGVSSLVSAEAKTSINQLKEADVQNAMKDTRIEIWADQFSHNLTKLSIQTGPAEQAVLFEIKPGGDRSAQTKIPTTDIITFADLQNTLMMAVMGGM